MKNKNTETFCHSILGLKVEKRKALANLVMALGSNAGSNSVTHLSTSHVYHYQYSSIHDAIDGFYASSKRGNDRTELRQELLGLKQPHFPVLFDGKFHLWNTDSTPVICPHSVSLSDRSYVHVANNRIKGNRPVDIGYDYSVIGLNARSALYNGVQAAWNLPLSVVRIETNQVRGECTAKQINTLLADLQTNLGSDLVVNALDRQYATPEYIADTYEQSNLVNVIRLKSNRRVYVQLDEQQIQARRTANTDNRGANAVYGKKYKLNEVDSWEVEGQDAPHQTQEFGVQMGNGRKVVIRICCWKNRLLRSKRGKNMKDKPFDLMSVQVLDAQTHEPIYKRRMWLGLWGKRKDELELEQVYWAYRLRFDEEHSFRFCKQNLLMDSFQTPELEHLDNWMEIVHLAYWLLWVAKEECTCYGGVQKWQQYDPNYLKRREFQLPPTPAQVQRQLESIMVH